MRPLILTSAALAFALPLPATAQTMPGMDMGQKASPPPKQAEPPVAAGPGPAPTGQPADPMPGMDMGKPAAAPTADSMAGMDHSQHDMSAMPDMQSGDGQVGTAPAPSVPGDHAADALFDPAEMARARTTLRKENGAFSGSIVLIDLAEFQIRDGANGYRWAGEAWFGGDIDRLQIKTEGSGSVGERIDDAEVQALWSHAISPFFNSQLGVRRDLAAGSDRTYAVVGIEGMTPYWFRVNGQVFLSNKGDLHARFEGSYDARITQRLIFQPRLELDFAAQEVPEIAVGSGLSSFSLGARVRYEIRKEFAPYVGIEWARKSGGTARYARLRGEDPGAVNLVAGIRIWF